MDYVNAGEILHAMVSQWCLFLSRVGRFVRHDLTGFTSVVGASATGEVADHHV